MHLFLDRNRQYRLLKRRVTIKWRRLNVRRDVDVSENVPPDPGYTDEVFKKYTIARNGVCTRWRVQYVSIKWRRLSFRQVVHYSENVSHPSGYIRKLFKKYEISSCGRYIRHIRNRKKMLSIKRKGEYARVGLLDDDGKNCMLYVHRLVASTFLGRPSTPGLTVDHISRNKKDNSAKNLRWATRKVQALNRGTHTKTAQKIALIGYHKETNETRTFASSHDAAKELGEGFHRQNISRAVKNSGTCKGWTFTKDSLPKIDGQEFREWVLRNGTRTNIFFGNCGYMVDVFGTERENKTFSSGPDGYPSMQIGGKDKLIHVMVAILFHGESPGPDYIVHHIDGVKNNTCASNLVWITKSENTKHAWADGCFDDSAHKRRKCSIDGIEYVSIAAAVDATQIKWTTLKYRLISTSPEFATYTFTE